MAAGGMCTVDGDSAEREDVSALPRPSWREAVDGLVVDVEMAARATIPDAALRAQYIEAARSAAAEITALVERGALSPRQAAEQVSAMRNIAMESMRARTSSFGRSIAVWLKEEGATLTALEQRYAMRIYGRSFDALGEAAREQVWLKIVERAGNTRLSVNLAMRWAPRAGKVFLFASVAIAAWQVATSNDPAHEAGKQGAMLGGGIAGGAAAGAATGLVCGPGAPVCSGILMFVGGVVGALGGEWAFSKIAR